MIPWNKYFCFNTAGTYTEQIFKDRHCSINIYVCRPYFHLIGLLAIDRVRRVFNK